MDTVLSLLPLDLLGAVSLASVFMAMLALGAGVRVRRAQDLRAPVRPLVAALAVALVVVPVGAIGLATVFDLQSGALVGLLLMGISPGAPLALKKSAADADRLGFALVLQVAVALTSIVAVPLWILVLGALYGRDAGISLGLLSKQVFMAQLLPLACGVALARRWPDLARRIARPLLVLSGVLLAILALVVLSQIWRPLLSLPWGALAASVLLTLLAVAAAHAACGPARSTRVAGGTVAALRNPGTALLIASTNGLPPSARIMILAHVLLTALVLALYLAAMRQSASGSTAVA